jgi:hypothetical protein
MGVIFQRTSRRQAVHGQLAEALRRTPPDESDIEAQASVMAAATTGSVTVNWKPLLVALAIFGVLLLVAIVVDWKNMVDDSTIYTGFASTALGVVLGFLSGDAAATASDS